MKKHAVLFLIVILTASSLISVGIAPASIPKPSVPEFTVNYINKIYYVPPTYGIDQYTGKSITASYEHWIRETRIEVTIKNQPFSPYDNGYSRTINLYFGVRSKGHFADEWIYSGSGELQIEDYDAEDTTLTLYRDSTPSNGQIDFQVQAYKGYMYYEPNPSIGSFLFGSEVFNGTESGWSSPQTITINGPKSGEYYVRPSDFQSNSSATASSSTSDTPPSTSPSTSPDSSSSPSQDSASTTTPSQSVNETSLETILYGIAVTTAIVLIASLGVLVYVKKRRRQSRVHAFCYEML